MLDVTRQIDALRDERGRVPPERLAEFDELVRRLGRERMREAFGSEQAYGFHAPREQTDQQRCST